MAEPNLPEDLKSKLLRFKQLQEEAVARRKKIQENQVELGKKIEGDGEASKGVQDESKNKTDL